MSIADAMATNGMKELGYEYINFDGKHATKINTASNSVTDRAVPFTKSAKHDYMPPV